MKENDSLKRAREIAGQCWCDPETKMIEMDVRLAEAFAKRLAPYLASCELRSDGLVPCPFCGSAYIFHRSGSRCIECESCGASGPEMTQKGQTIDDAIAAWNHRKRVAA